MICSQPVSPSSPEGVCVDEQPVPHRSPWQYGLTVCVTADVGLFVHGEGGRPTPGEETGELLW